MEHNPVNLSIKSIQIQENQNVYVQLGIQMQIPINDDNIEVIKNSQILLNNFMHSQDFQNNPPSFLTNQCVQIAYDSQLLVYDQYQELNINSMFNNQCQQQQKIKIIGNDIYDLQQVNLEQGQVQNYESTMRYDKIDDSTYLIGFYKKETIDMNSDPSFNFVVANLNLNNPSFFMCHSFQHSKLQENSCIVTPRFNNQQLLIYAIQEQNSNINYRFYTKVFNVQEFRNRTLQEPLNLNYVQIQNLGASLEFKSCTFIENVENDFLAIIVQYYQKVIGQGTQRIAELIILRIHKDIEQNIQELSFFKKYNLVIDRIILPCHFKCVLIETNYVFTGQYQENIDEQQNNLFQQQVNNDDEEEYFGILYQQNEEQHQQKNYQVPQELITQSNIQYYQFEIDRNQFFQNQNIQNIVPNVDVAIY